MTADDHRKISEAAQRYVELAETEPFPRPQWIDAWQNLKAAIAELRRHDQTELGQSPQ